MKRLFVIVMMAALLAGTALAVPEPPTLGTSSAILMDAASGTILYEKNAHEQMKPASVTKIMSLLLAMEAIDGGTLQLTDTVTASEHASSMGGSQIYLEPGEQMTVDDLLKSVAVASANDACVAIGEHIAGSEEGFVSLMNRRAAELGMRDTHFENCTGLDAEGHMTTAYDIACMSRALLKHDLIRRYTTIWMDSIRDGAFGLTNTNKLVHSYNGITGLKTGFTNGAGFCISATAERDGMELIAVIMKGDTSKNRNADATQLLNYGFANYTRIIPGQSFRTEPVAVKRGTVDTVMTALKPSDGVILEKANVARITETVSWNPVPTAPIEKGQTLGYCTLTLDGQTLAKIPIVAAEAVERRTIGSILKGLFAGTDENDN